jgi:hypothetical protein
MPTIEFDLPMYRSENGKDLRNSPQIGVNYCANLDWYFFVSLCSLCLRVEPVSQII